MIPFKPRTVCPDGKNKAYLIPSYGGLNHSIEGNPKGRVTPGCVLPNCTGYVHGRVIEITGSDSKLCRGNAENYWAFKDGYTRSQTPQVGSIMCWRKGKAGHAADGAGHVAFVEAVDSHGNVTVSESGWTGTKANGRYWRLRNLKRVNGTYALGVNFFFQGFIHVYDSVDIPMVDDAVYRLYNPNSGFHFFTHNLAEARSLERGGWTYEGVAWKAPDEGTAIYRLYNPNDGDHVLTVSEKEKDALVNHGWKYEGVAFNSGGKKSVYRLYNPNSGEHFYTTNTGERDFLVSKGWKKESVAFYAEG